ncbi:unnamed protein product [Dimorphilus gyrociliatus]|uniref:Fatty acid hydroxylase domain-containing protein n=1 Tax=Dimorphilus gyrociliatus TaxID=2664684 RepID=A0A7I8W4M5_9ANNE|nr:unnamed protein product [Dimorphilus gyrociliatus]
MAGETRNLYLSSVEQKTDSFNSSFYSDKDWRILQPIWDLRFGYENVLSSPVFPPILCTLFYVIYCSIYTIIDLYFVNFKIIKRYKIQPDRAPNAKGIERAVLLTLWNNMVWTLPITMAQWAFTPNEVLPKVAPTLFEFIWQHFAALAMFDFFYFTWHSIHHKVRFLYKHCHAVHHEYYVCNSWVTQYLHPWELICVGFFTYSSVMIFNPHPMTKWSYLLFSEIISIDEHSGYDFPFMLSNIFKIMGGAVKHDMHHMRPLTNYAPFYLYWDWIFGTNCPGVRAGGYRDQAMLEYERKRKERISNMKGKQKHKFSWWYKYIN